MSRALDDLASRFFPGAVELLARTVDVRIPVIVTDTLRTPEEQEYYLRIGTSWTKRSYHLPRPPEGKSEAIDVVPRVVLPLKNWAPGHPIRQKLGELGEAITWKYKGKRFGFTWGGRWGNFDGAHFQIRIIR